MEKTYRLYHSFGDGERVNLSTDGSRNAILPIFELGEFSLEDERHFKMDDIDLSALKTNFTAKRTPCPVLYEHAKGPRGGLGGGKVVSLQVKDGKVLAHANLTKTAYTEIKDEEWLGISAGFVAERDSKGNIRPKRLLEVSLTNQPAFPGLGEPQVFQSFSLFEIKDGDTMALETPVEETTEALASETPSELASVASGDTQTPEIPAPVVPDAPVAPEELSSQVSAYCPCPNCPCPGCSCCKADSPRTEQAPCPCPNCPCPGCSCCKVDVPMPGMAGMSTETPTPEVVPVIQAAEAATETLEAVAPTATETEQVNLEAKVDLEARVNLEANVRAGKIYAEKIRADKVTVLLALAKKEGKYIPAISVELDRIANDLPEEFEALLPYMKQVVPTTTQMPDKTAPKIELGLLDGPEQTVDVINKAIAVTKSHPTISLQEAVALVRKATTT